MIIQWFNDLWLWFGGWITDVWQWFGGLSLEYLIASLGNLFYLLTFMWTAVEGETFVIFAGIAAHRGLLDPVLLALCAWAGSFCGDQVYFFLGRRFGIRLMKRFPRWEPGVNRALGLLKRHDAWFILSFRFIYGVRNFSSFAMGMSPLSWARFSLLNCVAALVWAVSFVGLGYLFGQGTEELLGDSAFYVSVGLLAVFLTVVWFVVSGPSRRAKRLAREAERAKAAGETTRPGILKGPIL